MLSHLSIFVMAYRTAPCPELVDWLGRAREQGALVTTGSQEYGIDVARNQNCNRFLKEHAPAGRSHLLMIDADMSPIAHESDAILHEPGDVIYLGYVGRSGSRGHFGQEDFGAGCCRISAAALQKIPRPWFKFHTSEFHDQKLACECAHFNLRARQCGYKPKMAGRIGHRQSAIFIPEPQTRVGWSMRWPEI